MPNITNYNEYFLDKKRQEMEHKLLNADIHSPTAPKSKKASEVKYKGQSQVMIGQN